MRPEDKLLILSTRQDFHDHHKNQVIELAATSSIQWDRVYRTAEQHGVAPIIYINLIHENDMHLGIPPQIIKQFKFYAFQQIVSMEKLADRLTNSLQFLEKNHLQVMLIKGIALAHTVYDYPWYTVSKDIDIILNRHQGDLTQVEHASIGGHFYNRGVEYDFYEHHDINMNGAIPIDFDRVWSDAQKMVLYGHNVYVMSPEDFLISVCINSCRKRYFRLKSLFDIAETTNKYNNLNWDNLLDKARAYECSAIVYTALQISDLTVGCHLPDNLLRSLNVGKARTQLINSTTRYLLKTYALSAYPFSGPTILGRKVNISLILTYLSYRGYQIQRKAGELQRKRPNNRKS